MLAQIPVSTKIILEVIQNTFDALGDGIGVVVIIRPALVGGVGIGAIRNGVLLAGIGSAVVTIIKTPRKFSPGGSRFVGFLCSSGGGPFSVAIVVGLGMTAGILHSAGFLDGVAILNFASVGDRP